MKISSKLRFGSYRYYMNQSIQHMFSKTMSHYVMVFTDDEMADICIKPEDRGVLEGAARLVGHNSTRNPTIVGTSTGIDFTAIRMTSAHQKFLVPMYAMNRVAGSEVSFGERHKDFLYHVEMVLRWSTEFGMLQQIVDKLETNLYFETWEQVGYVFPAAIALLENHVLAEDKVLRALKSDKEPPRVPNMTPEFRAACREATRIVGRAKLIKEPRTEFPADHWRLMARIDPKSNTLYPNGFPVGASMLAYSLT